MNLPSVLKAPLLPCPAAVQRPAGLRLLVGPREPRGTTLHGTLA